MLAIRRVLSTASVVAILSTGAVAASAARAATVAVTTGCVIFTGDSSDMILPVVGTGFTPGSLVTLSTSTHSKPTLAPLMSVQANAAGIFLAITRGPRFNSSRTQDQTFKLFATQSTDPAIAAVTSFRQVRAGYSRVPAPKRPSQTVTHVLRGFTGGGRAYAHFRHGGRTRTTKSLGPITGPCGIATRKMRALPTKSLLGKWTVYVDQSKTYSTKTRPQARLSFEVFRRFI